MATFDTLIDDLAGRFGLGGSASALVKEILAMISASPGGLGGFLDRLKSAGLASEAPSWLGHPDAAPIAAGQVERALGATAVSGIAGRLGLGQGAVSTALGYALPKIVGLLTPGGAVPAGVPPEAGAFLAQPQAAAAPVAPRRIDGVTPSAPNEPGVGRWLWPAVTALVVIGLLSYFWSTFNRMPPVAKAPEPTTPAPATVAQAPPAPAPAVTAQTTAPPVQQAPQPAAPAQTPSTDAQATASPAPAAAPAQQAPAPASTQTQATAPAPQAPPAPPAPPPPAPATTEQAAAPPAPPVVAKAEPSAAAPAAQPARFALSNDNGVVRASGVVPDQGAKTSIVEALS
ncbi:MAG TPA: YidB family protein, partial [Roseiarcus sp.]|nr:YidB family protein [Roseiarcus sp.]